MAVTRSTGTVEFGEARARIGRARIGARNGKSAEYPSNTALYADPDLVEDIDYARHHRPSGDAQPAVLAPHGGGIEAGTSELCLAIAGYSPLGRRYGHTYPCWMFEGLRPDRNTDLHVTSTRCDDPLAVALCTGSRSALAVHGFCPRPGDRLRGVPAVLAGGRDAWLRRCLMDELRTAGFHATDAAGDTLLGGSSPRNIVNRTSDGQGAQLELTEALRQAMFTTNTLAGRKTTATPLFWTFVHAVRTALTRLAHR